MILVATGMSRETARFQARSAFTGTGFTTRESEPVVSHPVRRRVVMGLMLLGNAGIVAAASTLIIGFRGGGAGAQWIRILELVVGLVVLVFGSRNAWIDRRLTNLTATVLRRFTDLPRRDLESLLDLSGSYAVSELAVQPGDWVAGRSLGELALREEGVVVLGVVRRDGSYHGAPTGESRIDAHDTLVVYGECDRLAELDRRPAGAEGDRRHAGAAADRSRRRAVAR